jgi:integrase
MRPKEIENGVTVRHRHGIVGVKINGAKVRDTAGQPWRVLYVPADKFPAWFLDELGHGLAKVYAAPAAAMRSYLYRLSPKVFLPRSGANQQVLSAYVLRHAVATELRQEGWSEEKLAAVLGERVAETARHYGLYRRGARGGHQPEVAIVRDQVKTAIPVRVRDKHWLKEVRPRRKVHGV